MAQIKANAAELARNLLKDCTEPYVKPLLGLLEYEWDVRQMQSGKVVGSIQKTYDFNLLELHKKVPVEQMSNGKTTLLLESKGGKISQRLLNIQ